jgi:hypothetical protein
MSDWEFSAEAKNDLEERRHDSPEKAARLISADPFSFARRPQISGSRFPLFHLAPVNNPDLSPE